MSATSPCASDSTLLNLRFCIHKNKHAPTYHIRLVEKQLAHCRDTINGSYNMKLMAMTRLKNTNTHFSNWGSPFHSYIHREWCLASTNKKLPLAWPLKALLMKSPPRGDKNQGGAGCLGELGRGKKVQFHVGLEMLITNPAHRKCSSKVCVVQQILT